MQKQRTQNDQHILLIMDGIRIKMSDTEYLIDVLLMDSGSWLVLIDSRVPLVLIDSRVPLVLIDSRVPLVLIDSRVPLALIDSRVPLVLIDSRVPLVLIDSRVPSLTLLLLLSNGHFQKRNSRINQHQPTAAVHQQTSMSCKRIIRTLEMNRVHVHSHDQKYCTIMSQANRVKSLATIKPFTNKRLPKPIEFIKIIWQQQMSNKPNNAEKQLNEMQPYPTETDIWSLGCILYEKGNIVSLMQKIRDAEYPPFPYWFCQLYTPNF
ncbi:hypothetical protein GPALN_016240 [Globodera pallida]|nr:hypothetical protein GPALN_016240 [Globodera pallida]